MVETSQANSVSFIRRVLDKSVELRTAEQALREYTSSATAAFFDLSGSTDYRAHRGQDRGLLKAYRHNVLVSEVVEKHGGDVVKWMGDGLLACFSERDSCPAPTLHPYRAVRAALDAIQTLGEYNKRAGEGGKEIEPYEQIHTKVGICSGRVHYILLTANSNQAPMAELAGVLDPMGTAVDVASRLQSLADRDQVVVEANTFWGTWHAELHIGSDSAISLTPENQINWREIEKSVEVPASVYRPCFSAFFATESGLIASRRAPNGGGRIAKGAFERIADEEFLELKDSTRGKLFGMKPTACNVRGVVEPLRAVALARELLDTLRPIIEVRYQPMAPRDSMELVREGETAYASGSGDLAQARRKFEEALKKDARNVRANIFLALIARHESKLELADKHLEAALSADPSLAITWKIRGISRLLEFVAGKQSSIDLAIEDLTQAGYKAAEVFDVDAERCCDTCLALAFCFRDANGDTDRASAVIERRGAFARKTGLMLFMEDLLDVMVAISGQLRANYGECEAKLGNATTLLADPVTRGDSIFEQRDLAKILAYVELRLKLDKIDNPG